jgi:hypothetical protein
MDDEDRDESASLTADERRALQALHENGLQLKPTWLKQVRAELVALLPSFIRF